MFETENRVAAAQRVTHDTRLYPGQPVVISKESLYGQNGVIRGVGYSPLEGEVISIDLIDRGTWGTFSRTEFRIRNDS